MLFSEEIMESVIPLLRELKLLDMNNEAGKDKQAKIDQILAYLETLHTEVKNYSRKRELLFVDCGAGNCFLSFLVYFYFTRVDKRNIRIHCVEWNERLMERNRERARKLGFDKMFFHACDIADFRPNGQPDAVYSLHACDTATDKMLHLGLDTNARNILSVSCCQHSMTKNIRSRQNKGITRHRIFKEKLAYMVSDSMRSLLLEMQGYDTTVIDFVSTRATDKNTMIRARKSQTAFIDPLIEEYLSLRHTFQIAPALESYLYEDLKSYVLPMRKYELAG